jgi:FrmR/RcnR family transcriptional regulator, repressor of frmRAB operon
MGVSESPAMAYIISYRGILSFSDRLDMSHTIRNKKKLQARVSRIRGQVEAVHRALENESECGEVLRLIASARGAMNSLMAEVVEDHIRTHAFPSGGTGGDAADELVDVVRSYLT